MKRIANIKRARKLIVDTINSLDLNLAGMCVLTEAGSGPFIVTPLIAALSGADKVYAITKDSSYGKKEEISEYLREIAYEWKINSDVISIIDTPLFVADKINIITNLGFVRPIKRDLISKLPFDSAIPLMWETWELRDEDIDIKSAIEFGIPIMGTDETDKRLCIFRYVGMIVLKLLMEEQIEVFKSNILLVSSGRYLEQIEKVLLNNGANLFIYNPYYPPDDRIDLERFARICDAVVVAEQQNNETLISGNKHIHADWLDSGIVRIIHVAGVLDYQLLDDRQLIKYPAKKIKHGYMTVTTDYVGVRPVIELHSAGLKVGQALVEGMRIYKDITKAKKYALEVSPAMDL